MVFKRRLGEISQNVFRSVGFKLVALSDLIGLYSRSLKITEREDDWVTVHLDGIEWRLNVTKYVDNTILKYGVFEPNSIKWIKKIVKPGMVVADVGANFGYYTIQLSRLIGSSGSVHAFEPSEQFRERLIYHICRNQCRNVILSKFGLSDSRMNSVLYGGNTSATLHWCDDRIEPYVKELIELETLDNYIANMSLNKLDFIKVDIDGHESRFVTGAIQTLKHYQPIVLMEFMELALLRAGSDVEELAEKMRELGYILHSERTGLPFSSSYEFLTEAKNCAFSTNILCIPKNKNI
jgi:FkbM family methyltransferase